MSKGLGRSVALVNGVFGTLPVEEAFEEVGVRSAKKTSGEKT